MDSRTRAGGSDRFRVLIFHIRISMGHERAAQAVAESFRRRLGERAEVRLVEAMSLSSGWLAPMVCQTYLSIVKYAPALWDFLYDDEKSDRACEPLIRQMARQSRKRYLDVMAEFQPNVVVCTQALPARILGQLKEWGYGSAAGMSAPVYAAVTDYSIHRYWPSEEIAGYFVPGRAEFQRLMELGVPASRIRCSGIPIHPEISEPVSEEALSAARIRLGLVADRQTVLLMGGSRGMGVSRAIMRELEHLPISLNILAPAGTNPTVLAALREWAGISRHHVAPLEYTSDIRTLYALSDLAITKPGGLTIAECLSVGLPMVIQHALPGQERHNLEYIRREGLGETGVDAEDVVARVRALLQDDVRREYMKSRMKASGKPDAAFFIVDHLLRHHSNYFSKPSFLTAGESTSRVIVTPVH